MEKLSGPWKVGGWFCTIWLLDYFTMVYWPHYPFLYCAGDFVLRPLFAPLCDLALMACAAFFFFAAIGYGLFSRYAMGAVLAMFLIAASPQFAVTLFAFGTPGLCH